MLTFSAVAVADSGELAASISCVVQPKYAICSVNVAPPLGQRVVVAEANVLKEPPFIQAVRTKARYDETKSLRPNLRLGFLVKGAGSGDLVVQAHATTCSDSGGGCQHSQKILRTTVSTQR